MAATYNGSVANLVDPLANSPLNSPSHSGQHTEINDALQTLGTWTAYTPTWTNVTVGSGTVDFDYIQFNKTVVVRGRFVYGSGSAITGIIRFTLPVTAVSTSALCADCRILDAGIAGYVGLIEAVSASQMQVVVANTASTYGSWAGTSGTVPFTWATGDLFEFVLIYEAA